MGSPAHAGIDPWTNPLSAVTPGFPRTRGDRPSMNLDPDNYDAVPPHTRG